ncbi:hypothetical protein RRG08_021710 [Elysia crispata]|uniref:Uncharacterized protein n=1 Tax=Elysia crispata TaxID=231223 RepID=A0AAE0ZXN1_9GAST|nr:hypothetical protein RRG08_021710 [Elysia crispata]
MQMSLCLNLYRPEVNCLQGRKFRWKEIKRIDKVIINSEILEEGDQGVPELTNIPVGVATVASMTLLHLVES